MGQNIIGMLVNLSQFGSMPKVD